MYEVEVWAILLGIFLGSYGLYYLYMRKVINRNWHLNVCSDFLPEVTIMVPVHNEEKTIELKLENLSTLKYPKDKLQILLVNDASTDKTLEKINAFSRQNLFPLNLVNLEQRTGKVRALNTALSSAKGDIIVISDSDAFLPSNVLGVTMPYFADPLVSGVISREELLDSNISWVSESENIYMNLTYGTIKLGESKIHSTIIFHGGFAAYRRTSLDCFNVKSDDTGTALDIVQKGYRTIMVPEVASYSLEFSTWKAKFNSKVRRANHTKSTWIRCLSLLLNQKLLLPKRIAIPEIFLYLFNPFILLALCVFTIPVAFQHFWLPLTFCLGMILLFLVKKSRLLLVEILQSNFFLLFSTITSITGKDLVFWENLRDPQMIVTRSMLQKRGLL